LHGDYPKDNLTTEQQELSQSPKEKSKSTWQQSQYTLGETLQKNWGMANYIIWLGGVQELMNEM
jgi:hypothetical protein